MAETETVHHQLLMKVLEILERGEHDRITLYESKKLIRAAFKETFGDFPYPKILRNSILGERKTVRTAAEEAALRANTRHGHWLEVGPA